MNRLFAMLLALSMLCACAAPAPAGIASEVSSSAPEVSSSASSPEESAAPAVEAPAAVAVAAVVNPPAFDPLAAFTLNSDVVLTEKLYRYSDQVSVFVSGSNHYALLAASKPVPGDDLGAPLTAFDSLMITMQSDEKYTFVFYEKGVKVSYAAAGADAGTPTGYVLDTAVYAKLIDLLQTNFGERKRYSPAWFSIMRASKLQTIAITSADGTASATYDNNTKPHFEYAFEDLVRYGVEPNSLKIAKVTDTLPNATTLKLTFKNGIIYNIWINEKELLIRSSDMDYSVRYTSNSNDRTELEELASGRFIPRTGKPVIYLYPGQKTDVSVKLDFKGRVTYTYPAYNNGWNVTAYPDGRLVNKADGTEHFYLFWDGTASVDWRFDEGFVVAGADTQKFLVEKLSHMGLTPREYNDFIVYWLPELQQNPYNLITFADTQYTEIAPLTISPAPDSLLRVHMVFRGLNAPVKIPAQVLPTFERSGFTVVEWGGTRA